MRRNILLIRDDNDPYAFHPRIELYKTESYHCLPDNQKKALYDLYISYAVFIFVFSSVFTCEATTTSDKMMNGEAKLWKSFLSCNELLVALTSVFTSARASRQFCSQFRV